MSPALRESMEAIVADWEKILVEAIAPARQADAGAGARTARGRLRQREVRASKTGWSIAKAISKTFARSSIPEGKRKTFVGLGRYWRHAVLHPRARAARADRTDSRQRTGNCGRSAGRPANLSAGAATAAQMERAVARRTSAARSSFASIRRAVPPSAPTWCGGRCARRRGAASRWSSRWATWRVRAATTSRRAPTRSWRNRRRSPARSGSCTRNSISRGLLADFGVGFRLRQERAEISDAMSISRPMTDRELAQVNETIGHLYDNFTAKVAQGRRLSAGTGRGGRARPRLERTGGAGSAVWSTKSAACRRRSRLRASGAYLRPHQRASTGDLPRRRGLAWLSLGIACRDVDAVGDSRCRRRARDSRPLGARDARAAGARRRDAAVSVVRVVSRADYSGERSSSSRIEYIFWRASVI